MHNIYPIPTGKTPINELLEIAESAIKQPNFRAGKYRKHREAWVLARFAILYNAWSGAPLLLAFAELGDSEEIQADFGVYDAGGKHVADIEVTELTDIWDWWSPGVHVPEVPNPWANLAGLLQKKHGKAATYRAPTWLLIYDNAISGIYRELEGVKFGASEAGRVHTSDFDFMQSSVTAVWILSSDGFRAVRLMGERIDLRGGNQSQA